jgi:putative ABC transport system permease protein
MGVKLLVAMSPAGIAPIKGCGVDGYTVGFACVVVFLTIILTGLLPALHASKTDVNEMLKAQPSAGSVRHNVRYALPALMVTEVALTLVLLVGAGLMIKSFLRLLAVPKGFNPAGVLTMELSPSAAKYPRSSHRRAYNQELLTRVQALPGVRSAGLTSFLPLTGTTRVMPLKVEGRAPFDSEKIVPVDINIISPDYFQTMGIQMIAGRPFTAKDVDETQHVAIINQTIARRFFPNENPIGLRLAEFAKPKIIVGVVADTRHFGLDQEVQPEVFLPYLQDSNLDMSLVVRTSTDPKNSASLRSLATAVRNEVRAMEPNQPVNQIVAMEKYLMDSVSSRQFRMFVLAIFAAVALIITIAGIYGVISYVVSQRTHEIGIRISLGAQVGDVLRMVIWRGMSLTLIGVALGVAASLALTRVMKNLLFEVSATDPATFTLFALLLVGAALIASYIPARRATKVDPLQALRHD